MGLTVADIRKQACRLADKPEPVSGATDWLETDEILAVINQGIGELQDHIAARSADDLTARADLSVPAGVESVAVPANLLAIREVYLIDSGGQRVRLSPGTYRGIEGSARTDSETYPSWQLLGSTLWLYPARDAACTLELWFVRALVEVTNDADEIRPEIPSGWDRYVVGYVGAYILGKAESDPSPAVSIMQRVLQAIEDHAARRGGRRSLGGRIRMGGDRDSELARLPRP